jgi:hypothetical protein
MRTALLIAFSTVLPFLAVPGATGAPADGPPDCAARIQRQAAGQAPAPLTCWRLGPVALGMTREAVVQALGQPDIERDGPPIGDPDRMRHDRYRLAYYVFPRDLAQRLAREPQANVRFRVLEIAYVTGRVAQVSNSPPARISWTRCDADPARPPRTADGPPAEFAPYLSFAGLKAGDSVAALTARFGKPWTISTAHDFYNYGPFPLTLEIGDDDGRVGGFSIGTDSDTVLLGGFANIEFVRAPGTCRVSGFHFLSSEP